MGDFRIQVEAIGGHGCERETKDGGRVFGCKRADCPDCLTTKFVSDMARLGCTVKSATLTHWPGTPEEVVDVIDIAPTSRTVCAPRTRKGSF